MLFKETSKKLDFNNMKIRRDGFNFRGTIDSDDFLFRGANL